MVGLKFWIDRYLSPASLVIHFSLKVPFENVTSMNLQALRESGKATLGQVTWPGFKTMIRHIILVFFFIIIYVFLL